jgi:hypothetical protein
MIPAATQYQMQDIEESVSAYAALVELKQTNKNVVEALLPGIPFDDLQEVYVAVCDDFPADMWGMAASLFTQALAMGMHLAENRTSE